MSTAVRKVVPGAVYVHYKGGRYLALGVARNSEAREQLLVVYVSLSNGKVWSRPLLTHGVDSWCDGLQWPDKVIRQRFEIEADLPEQDLLSLRALWEGT